MTWATLVSHSLTLQLHIDNILVKKALYGNSLGEVVEKIEVKISDFGISKVLTKGLCDIFTSHPMQAKTLHRLLLVETLTTRLSF